MSELPMRGHFRYLRFKTFATTPITPQCKVFCPLLSSFEHSGVPEDSNSSLFPNVGLHPHTWPKWGCDRKGYLFGGQWKEKEKVLCLVANGRRRRRFFSTSSHFPPKQLHLDLHFLSFDIKVLFYHGPKPLFMHALLLPWPINYDRIS